MLLEETSSLARRATIADICEVYSRVIEEVSEAYVKLASADARMAGYSNYLKLLPRNAGDDYARHCEDAKANVRRSIWRELLNRTGVWDAMTQDRRTETDRKIEHEKLPEVTPENVESFLAGLQGELGQIIQESITAASRILRPPNSQYKTNRDGWQLGEKAITEYGVEGRYPSGLRINYRREGDLAAIDNAFSMLAGNGPVKYPGNLLTVMRTALQEDKPGCETEYFRLKWFKNGNIHWEFLRADLVAELNRAAADHYSLRKGGGN